jgi:uncharacterized protein (TIGR02646 family)
MRKIEKGQPPAELTEWRRNNAAAPQNLFYGLADFPLHQVLDALLKEQGYVCAYTLLRLGCESAHVEHLKPQSACKIEDSAREVAKQPLLREDIAWCNMVACFPKPNSMVRPEFGAVKKDKWWDEANFVSPLEASCAVRFRFNATGEITPAVTTDVPAQTTILKIGLDNKKLCELRERAFLDAGIHRRANKPIMSATKVEHLVAKWSNKDVATSTCVEFCVPMIQVAKEYAQFLRARGLN